MSQSRALFILNPTAAKNQAGERRGEIEAALKARGITFETRLTTGVWHAAELARRAGREGFPSLIAAGGDGTMNEVINGLMLAKAEGGPVPSLGVLPAGRGNDFAFGLGLPASIESAADLISEGRTGPLDVGFVKGGDYPEGRYFGNGLGLGFDALAHDGLLDFCVVGEVNRREMATLIARYTKGTQKGRPKVTMGRATSYSIEAPHGGLDVHADGETICRNGSSIAVDCKAAALQAFGAGRR